MGRCWWVIFLVCVVFPTFIRSERVLQGTGQKQSDDKDYATELPRILPTEPGVALKSFKLAPGFKIELVAAEPMIRSPVAVDFDEEGRMYVAEFPEYNQHGNPKFKERGCIKRLEDTTGNGVYDKVTVFADQIDSPVALACWDGGVFVGSVPDILYLKDTDGDGKADLRKVVYTGFHRDRAGEAMFNSFRWGLDHRFHVSTSASGGNVKREEAREAEVFNVRGHGFLFDPRSHQFELVAGSGQHGMSMDDWGRKFTCDNSNPCHLLMYDSRYLRNNHYVAAPPPMLNIHPENPAGYLLRLSPNEPWRVVRTRLRLQGVVPGPKETGQPSGHFTGTTGVTVYRGDAFPPENRGTLFIGEVANNLVYHARLEPRGLAMTTRRVEKDREFLACTDPWFRPVQFANAPDGTLYVIDMYRELIETIESIPPRILKHLHPEAGIERGRIYRVVPDKFQRPALPRLTKASSAELVALLAHPNGWHRDTASRLLYQRQDPQVILPLQKMVLHSPSSLGRLHALYALDGMQALNAKVLLSALSAEEPRLREHALRLSERFQNDVLLRTRILQMTDDPDLHVRYQLAFTLGTIEGDSVSAALHRLAILNGVDSWIRFALLTSAHGRRGEVLRRLAGDEPFRLSHEGNLLLSALAGQIGAANQTNEIADFLVVLDRWPTPEDTQKRVLMASLMSNLPVQARDRLQQGSKSGEYFKNLLAEAMKNASDEKAALADRLAAVRMLGLAEWTQVQPLFKDLLQFRQPLDVQKSALETLARFDQPAIAQIVMDAWPGLSPPARATATETLFARSRWLDAFLDAVEQGKIKTSEIDPARIQLLQGFANPAIRRRASQLFASIQLSRRQDVVAAYQKSLQLQGHARNGKELFKKNCAACHRLEGVGEALGAELNAIKDRGADFILLNILDPNREVLPKFITYSVVTDSGRTLTGMITSETATSITLRRPDGTSETLLRIHVEELRSTGMSFMPEGLEKQLDLQQMADLLAYLMTVP